MQYFNLVLYFFPLDIYNIVYYCITIVSTLCLTVTHRFLKFDNSAHFGLLQGASYAFSLDSKLFNNENI